MISRGVRNNNPLNLRRTSDKWVGLRFSQTDKDFFQFESDVYGFRAAAKVIYNYIKRGQDSIAQIVSTWAPSSENDTANYIRIVSAHLGVPASSVVTDDMLPLLLRIMAYIETGKWYDMTVIQDGISLLKKT